MWGGGGGAGKGLGGWESMCVGGWGVCLREGAGRGQGGSGIVPVKLPPDSFKFVLYVSEYNLQFTYILCLGTYKFTLLLSYIYCK